MYIVDLSISFAHRLCIDPACVRGKRVAEAVPEEASLAIEQLAHRVLASRRTLSLAFPIKCSEQSARLVEMRMKPLGVDCVLATLPGDIICARRQSDQHLLEMLGSIENGVIYVLDLRSNAIVYVTDRVKDLVGVPREMLGGLILDLAGPQRELFELFFHPDDAGAVSTHLSDLRAARNDTVMTLVFRMRHVLKGWRWIEARSRILSRDRSGAVARAVGIAVDITELKRLNETLHATSCALLQAEENERRRIAREIHDSTAQLIVALDLGLSQLETMAPLTAADLRTWVDEMRTLTKAAHRELRVATFALHPPELECGKLSDTLDGLVRGFGRRTGLATDFELEGAPRAVSQAVEHALLRVSQEALMNVHKHANARVAKLRLRYEAAAIVLEIEDDGGGAGAEQSSPWETAGVGLQSMKARLTALGGVLSIISSSEGFMIRARVPLQGSA
ncbi:MAG: PAS domain-containing protein [Hyphomonadaceae bacterium]|nr:PAS domain-containing protein [Hyphomonadaceae bacterium]